MNKKILVALELVVISLMMVGSVMAAPTKGNAPDKNPNIVQVGAWTRLENDGVPLNGWNENGRHVVYVDTTNMGQGAIDAKLAHGWQWSGLGGGGIYLFKEVQPAD